MTIHHQSHQDCIDSGLGFEWDLLPAWLTTIDGYDQNDEMLRLWRKKKSHKGVSFLKDLKILWACAVDQDFLDEICNLENLEFLALDKVTAKDFSRILNLKKLKTLIIENASSLNNIEWVTSLPDLTGLQIMNCKNLNNIQRLESCTRLKSLGIEGGMWEPMRINSLQPLSALINLSYLFITNLKVADKSLHPLSQLINLKVIHSANFYSKEEFLSLSLALPKVRCDWFPNNQS